jgi:hypothetical protein
MNVRRKRHSAELFQNFEEDAVKMKLKEPVAARKCLRDVRRQLSFSKNKLRPFFCLVSGPGQTFPVPISPVAQQDDFNSASRCYFGRTPGRRTRLYLTQDSRRPEQPAGRKNCVRISADFCLIISQIIPFFQWRLGDEPAHEKLKSLFFIKWRLPCNRTE